MHPGNAFNRADHLFIGERRAAAFPVPAQQKFGDDFLIHVMPEQMAGEGGDSAVSRAFCHTLTRQIPPMPERMPGSFAVLLQVLPQPFGQLREWQGLRIMVPFRKARKPG